MKHQHKDKFGQPITEGCYVAFVYKPMYSNARGSLEIGRVIDTTPKQVRIQLREEWRDSLLRPASDVLVMRGEYEDLMMLSKITGTLRNV